MWIAVTLICIFALIALLATGGGSETKVVSSGRNYGSRSGTGAPLFLDGEGRKGIAEDLHYGMHVWALTSFGPQKLIVVRVDNEAGYVSLQNDLMVAHAECDDAYFDGLGSSRRVWRVTTVNHSKTTGRNHATSSYAAQRNRRWIEEEAYWGDEFDMFDAILMYHFMFVGFDHPQDYYEEFDVPVYEPYEDAAFDEGFAPEQIEAEPGDPPIVVTDDPIEIVDPPVVDEPVEEPVVDEPVEEPVVDEPVEEPVVDEPVQPEPIFREPDPVYEPEPETNTWGGDDDSGSSWDSGDDDW